MSYTSQTFNLHETIHEHMQKRTKYKEDLVDNETAIANLEDVILREKKGKIKREKTKELEVKRSETRRIQRDLANANDKLVEVLLRFYQKHQEHKEHSTENHTSKTLLRRAKPFGSRELYYKTTPQSVAQRIPTSSPPVLPKRVGSVERDVLSPAEQIQQHLQQTQDTDTTIPAISNPTNPQPLLHPHPPPPPPTAPTKTLSNVSTHSNSLSCNEAPD